MKNVFLLTGCLLMGFALMGCQSTALTSAKVYLQQDDLGRAEEQLKAAVTQHPEDAEAHYWLGTIYARTGRYELMNASFDRSMALNPKHQKDIAQGRQKYYVEHYNRGVEAVQSDDFASAAKAFEEAAVIDPKQIEAFKNLAFCQYKLDQPDKALATYKQALALSSEDADILTKMASIHYEQGDYEKTAAVFEEISRLGKANVHTLSSLASAYERLKQPDQAIAAYEKAAALNPEDENLPYNIAVLYSNQEKYEQAVEYYKRALQLKPDDLDAKFNLALAYVFKLAQWDEALPILKELVQTEPGNVEAWEMLSVVYARKGEVAESKRAYEKAEELKGLNP
ncbi:MAG: tetratricopeptide repeat protein [Candidatus Latescibacteria bacterium]|nr:tetratricopeptide repeat protein [Candidatus Latescibacterota bacterium]